MNQLIEDWKKNSARKQDSIFDFLRWLKTYKSISRVDKVARESHEEIFAQIDCTKCANCCKTMSPQVKPADVKRISAFLEIPEKEFVEKYLKTGDENEYLMNALPCPFLKDDKCSIYEVRPKDCRDYPHTTKQGFTTRRYMHQGNTEVCPAVYQIIETMKDRFNWRESR